MKVHYTVLLILAILIMYLALFIAFSGNGFAEVHLRIVISLFQAVLAIHFRFPFCEYRLVKKIGIFIFSSALLYVTLYANSYFLYALFVFANDITVTILLLHNIITVTSYYLFIKGSTRIYNRCWLKLNSRIVPLSLLFIIVTTLFVDIGNIIMFKLTNEWIIKTLYPNAMNELYNGFLGGINPLAYFVSNSLRIIQLASFIFIIWNNTSKSTIVSIPHLSDVKTR